MRPQQAAAIQFGRFEKKSEGQRLESVEKKRKATEVLLSLHQSHILAGANNRVITRKEFAQAMGIRINSVASFLHNHFNKPSLNEVLKSLNLPYDESQISKF